MNLEAIYHAPEIVGSELSLEELRAGHRGWLSKVWQPEVPPKQNHEDSPNLEEKTEESNVNTDNISEKSRRSS